MEKITIKEKIIINLFIIIIKILKPYQYSHEFDKEFESVKKLINE